MSDDYLWDKSGTDPEIEDLESVLAVFKYQRSDAPAITPAILTAPQPFWARIVSVRLGFGLITAGAVLASFLWLGFRPPAHPDAVHSLISEAGPANLRRKDTDDKDAVVALNPGSRPISTAHKKAARANAAGVRFGIARNRVNYRNVRVDAANLPAFTKEEWDAYTDLMLALSITSSKLKLVQDTIDRVEDPKSSFKQQ